MKETWSSAEVAPSHLMAALQDQLSVALIATPRRELRTCRSNETLVAVMARNREGFDYFPVTDAASGVGEQIIGLVELVPFLRNEKPEGIVDERMRRLSEDNLVHRFHETNPMRRIHFP